MNGHTRIALLSLWFCAGTALAQSSWTTSSTLIQIRNEANQPLPPVRIIGNIYHVGAANLAVFLLTTPQGHILIDSGFEETVPIIRTNIERLGFKLTDIKILLCSHAHMDHVAGHAAIKKITGATVMAMEGDAAVLAAGGKGDFRWETEAGWEPLKVDRLLKDGDTVSLDDVTLRAFLTPGHSKGNTTWTTVVQEGGKSYQVVFAGSTTINDGVVLLNNPKYPAIATAYEQTFRVLRSLPCDVFLSGHGAVFRLQEKLKKRQQGASENPFIDPKGYQASIDEAERTFRQQLEGERQRSKQ